MFRAIYAHHQEVELYWCSIWHLQFSPNLYTRRLLTDFFFSFFAYFFLELILKAHEKILYRVCNKIFELAILDSYQRDAHLLYFTIYFLHSSTRFEHSMLIIRRFGCVDAASGIVLSVSGRPVHRLGENCREVLSQPVHRTATDWEDDTRCCINTIQPPDDEHIMLETCRGM